MIPSSMQPVMCPKCAKGAEIRYHMVMSVMSDHVHNQC